MNKPKFSVALIARNEALTLPRMIGSLKEFQERGGEIWVLDTGSTDNTVEVAKSLGCKVEAVGDKFRIQIDKELADKINTKFVIDGEAPVVNAGESLFDFASARNYIADFPENDMIATPDCDEIFTKFDIDKLDEVIANGAEQLEYEFVFSHDHLGNPVIKFRHCKFYNRKKLKWVGVIHEVLAGSAKMQYLGEDIIKLEHYQNEKTNRSGYLKGLALDCYNHPDNDRNSHYFAREMFYLGRYHSAIKEFLNHISMNRWVTEASQSMLYIGDAYKILGKTDDMLLWWMKSVEKEARREPLMRLAEYYFAKGMYPQVIVFAEAALAVTQVPFYSNHQPYYENIPHELLYVSYWWVGNRMKSAEHYFKALAFCPTHPKYINDGKYYGIKTKLDTYIDKIKNNENFTFVKRGDGEIACMTQTTGANCDGHPYTQELGDKLKESFEFLKDKADIVEWNDQKNYNVLLHRKDNDLEKLRNFWMTIKESPRKKIFVGPKRLEAVIEFLKIDKFIEVPEVNAFEYLKKNFEPFTRTNDIFIFSCGMPAKWLIATLVGENPNITCIDAGSSFDPIFVGQTRTEQADSETLRRLYLRRPSQEELNKMFSLPQDSHPEKLYKLIRITDEDKVIYDLGCSTFKTLDRAIGIDIEAKQGVDIVHSVDSLPMIASGSTDVILASHILEHIQDTKKTLTEWARILKDDGKIIIMLPDDEFIDTLNPILSGEGFQKHIHTFTRHSLKEIVETIPGLEVEYLETVMEGWSFGGIIRKRASVVPKMTFVIPTLGREEGLNKCLESIKNLNYPQDKIEVIVKHDSFENRIGVPKLMKQGYEESTGDWIVFASNDTEFTPDSINEALWEGQDGYVAFNTGLLYPDEGNINEHFMIRRDIVEKIGEIFDTDFYHCGVDNLLWAKMKKLGIAKRAPKAVVKHHHWSKTVDKKMDETYKAGWSHVEEDRELLAKKLKELNEQS
jgi:glycosyltransferase involved in cell wall biosynthesis